MVTEPGGDDALPQRPNAQGASSLLGFGTQVVLDGRAAAAEAIASRERVTAFVSNLIDQIEPANGGHAGGQHEGEQGGTTSRLLGAAGQASPGVSAVVTRGETAVMLHTFSDVGRLTLRLVSARSVPVDLVIRAFKAGFTVGRYQSHVTSRFRAFPSDGDELERFLVGERAYACLRLDEPLAP
ncbi:MAG TPA: hypothetical protein VFD39_12620 [Trueperaceae bacterium]|nr:hypothetical protein [Trueperaceae bacterium]